MSKLESDCKLPAPEFEHYLYLHFFSRNDTSIISKVTESRLQMEVPFTLMKFGPLGP